LAREVEIAIRADAGFAIPAIYDYCEEEGIEYTIGLAPLTADLRSLRLHCSSKQKSNTKPKSKSSSKKSSRKSSSERRCDWWASAPSKQQAGSESGGWCTKQR
jgi:hypothetical protein